MLVWPLPVYSEPPRNNQLPLAHVLVANASPITVVGNVLPAKPMQNSVISVQKKAVMPLEQRYKLLEEAGIAKEDWVYADFIVMAEGHYDPCVRNGNISDCSYATNGGGKSYGVCQAKPGNKMASAGPDWATNIATQLRWCNSYAQHSHGNTWASNYAYWLAHKYW